MRVDCHLRTLTALLCLVTASCGGEGNNGGGGTPISGTPMPTPAPSPSPTPAPAAAAPFGLTQSAVMGTLGLLESPGIAPGFRWLGAGELQISWQAPSNTFAMTIPAYGAGTLVDDPAEAAPSARYLVDAGGNRQAKVNLPVPDGGAAGGYVLSGTWTRLATDSFPDWTAGSFLYFTADSVRTPPTGGAAVYQLGHENDARSRLTVDFAAGTVSGGIPLTWTDAWGPHAEVRYIVRDGRYDRATGTITGAFDVPGSGFAGEFRGQVLGLGGQAIAIVIRGATFDPYDQKWVSAHTLTSHLRE